MNLLDLIVMTILIYHVVLGIRRGLIRILFDLSALVVGIFVALKYYLSGDVWLQSVLHVPPPYSTFTSFIVIWGVLFSIFTLLGRLTHQFSKVSMILPFNILGGGLLGGFKGLMYTLPILIPLSHTSVDLYHQSEIAKPLNTLISEQVMPSGTQGIFSQFRVQDKEKNVEKVLQDPALQRIKRALEKGHSSDIGQILSE